MKAVIYQQYGPSSVLQIAEVDKPLPQNYEILIKVHAAEVTKADCELRKCKFAVKWFWLPMRIFLGVFKPKRHILGGYFAGEVVEVGKDVTRFKPGDQVFGCAKLRLGAYGEYMCLPDSYTISHKPANVSYEEAAAVPLGGLNALHFMRRANIQLGDKVLINGAGGSIGTFALQIAKNIGAEVTVVDNPIKEQMLLAAGADHFIDYTKQDFTKSGQLYDVIFDMVARSSYSGCVRSLKPNGRYLMGNPRISDMLHALLTSWFTDKQAIFAFAEEAQEELDTLKQMMEEGKIRPVIDKIYPMDQVAQAHQQVETEQRLGIVVLSVS